MKIIINILHMKSLFSIWPIVKKFSPQVAPDSRTKLIKLKTLQLIEKNLKKKRNQKEHKVHPQQINNHKDSFTLLRYFNYVTTF